ncbi:MAG: hypothetical protein FWD61_20370 [Phycisphaerales bacterium]|nr:hypothetical protein [Phycisphaerales bacterium]
MASSGPIIEYASPRPKRNNAVLPALALGSLIIVFSTWWYQDAGADLSVIILLVVWRLIAACVGGTFADQNHAVLYALASILNLALFLIPALPIARIMHQRWPRLCLALIVASLVAVWFFLFCWPSSPWDL